MDKNQNVRLWIVSIVNRNGYEAPTKYVEAKTRKEAINLAKVCSNLITDYPKQWSFRLTPLYEIKDGRRFKNSIAYKE